MKTTEQLKQEFRSLKSTRVPRAEKLPVAEKIRSGISDIEMAVVRGEKVPYYEIEEARRFLVEIDAYLGRRALR